MACGESKCLWTSGAFQSGESPSTVRCGSRQLRDIVCTLLGPAAMKEVVAVYVLGRGETGTGSSIVVVGGCAPPQCCGGFG